MKSIYILIIVGAVTAREITFNDPNMPIKLVRTSYGHADNERIDHLRAVIRPHHLINRDHTNFPTSGYLNDYFIQIRHDGDERGHLLGPQFSGPTEWYNLSPQNARVNRHAGYQSITTDWFGTECEVQRFLEKGGDRFVLWVVDNSFVADSNRPDIYFLKVSFFEERNLVETINTKIRNPFLREDSNFWVCKSCRSNRYQNDELRKTGEGCSQG